jgi:hypothetical protein
MFLFSKKAGVRRSRRLLGRGAVAVAVAALLGIAGMATWQATQDLGPSWRALTGTGTKGHFTASDTYVLGFRHRWRVWTGRFVSDDGRIVRDPVRLEDAPADIAVGRPVPAIDTGAPRDVYGVPRGSALLGSVSALVLSMAAWSVAGWFLIRWLRRRRSGARRPGRAGRDGADGG